MLKVGLTGGIASGKSTVSQLFSTLGADIIDADLIAHQLVEPGQDCLEKIIQTFSKKILLNNGELDRQQLRQVIFSDPEAKQQLEAILHPKIRQQLITQSDNSSSPYCILSVPLLIEAKMTSLVNRILVIEIDADEQLKRLCQRDDISNSQAVDIVAAQSSSQQRTSMADDIIINNNSPEELNLEVENLHKKYLDLAKTISTGCQ
jgi:dephospho-CoA kinase